jgi:hypothetical protein
MCCVGVMVACNALTGVGDLTPCTDSDEACRAAELPDGGRERPVDAADASGGGNNDGDADADAGCDATCADDAGALVCTDLAIDPKNCGGCGTTCDASPNADPKCAASKCVLACNAGFADCDGDPKNGCECAADSCITATKQCAKRVFVTSALYKGDFGGLAGADAKCQERAVAASLPGTYKAWLSTAASSPSNRFAKATIPYRLTDGTPVANSYVDLTDGTLANPINKTETGGAAPLVMFCYPDFVRPWSSTLANGTFSAASGNCTDWTVQSGSAHWGAGNSTASEWSQGCSGGSCAYDAPLYCFQQ